MRKYRLFSLLQAIVDVAVVYFSYYLWFKIGMALGFQYTERNLISLDAFVPYALIAYLVLFVFYRLYDANEIDFYETFLGIVFSEIFLMLLGFAIPFFLRAFAVPRTVILFAFVIQTILLILSHLLIRRVYFNLSPDMKVLLISKNNRPDTGYLSGINNGKVIVEKALFDERKKFESFKDIAQKSDIILIDDSLKLDEKSELLRIFAYMEKPVYLVPGIYELMLLNPQVHIIGDFPIFEVNLVNVSAVDKFLKRLMDIFVSLVALVVFSPVMLIVSIAILLEDGRPIFYLQKRLGDNGKTFKTIKFRTMIKDAEKYTGAVLSTENDPRITKVGRFLRKTGLDEVPQFINVLMGDMSVVGPRPERPELMEKIRSETPNFDLRLKVKPGITGFAQLYGKYDTSFEAKLKMDLLYAKQRHPILTDIYIMFNTVKLFLSPHKRK